jgi:FMN phosphatase YigB (HAD superfamily)
MALRLAAPIHVICFDWGGTLMSEMGPQDRPMGLWPDVSAIAGAADCLASLARDRRPLCIATNATVSRRPMIELALERVGLLRYFSEIFCYTELGFTKGQPEFWRSVAERLQTPLDRIAMVGDSLEQDCLVPRSFGVQAVWFNEGGRQPLPEGEVLWVRSLEEFARLVKNAA